MLGNFEDVQKMSKTNIEAATEAFGNLSKTAQAIAAEVAEYSKRSYENGTKAMQKLFGVKSLDKAIEVQSEYAKSAFEDYSAQVTKLGQLYADLAKEVFKPFEAQMAKASPKK
jgi:phasin family protein